ncbi:endothelin-converting enzyme 2 [Lingula anatina]|uniref:Endothelin-converting enzyme 2 n=1 Tax=Lingula anatina TaxID=7574 RepID=A0A1S3KDG2_LINAN|nr:endothelin-converting enzyme 2 [Lingula anatina]|eukprot:XP_013420537.1 endothelin-converting enzyme 2 [Lingula anatina]
MVDTSPDIEMDIDFSSKTKLSKTEKKQQGWTGKEKCLLTLLILSVLIIIGIVAVFLLSILGIVDILPKAAVNDTTCTDLSCLEAASAVLSSMNTSVDPCEDIYRFACEGWMERNPRPPTQSRWFHMSKMLKEIKDKLKLLLEEPIKRNQPLSFERKLKDFYLSCTDTAGRDKLGPQPMLDIIQEIGGWNALGEGSWHEPSWDTTEAMVQVQTRFTGLTNQLFEVEVRADDQEPNVNILKIRQGGLGLPNRKFYFENETESKYIRAYKQFLQTTAISMGVSRENASVFTEEVFGFEKKLAEITFDSGAKEVRNPVLTYNKVTVEELIELTPSINWTLLLSIWKDDLSNTTTLLVFNKDYMKNVSALIDNTEKSVLNQYVVWTLLRKTASYLSREFRAAVDEYTVAVTGLEKPKELWEQCQDVVGKQMWKAVSAMFVREHFPRESKEEVIDMIKYMKRAFKMRIDSVKFMDESTRKAAHQKLDAMKYEKIGFPDYMLNDTHMDDIYKNLKINCSNCLFSTIQNVAEWERQRLREKLAKPVDKKEWKFPPHQVNAFYDRTNNEMVFLAGILQPPFFNRQFPKYTNYATIGHVIGHEITHGFDTGGSRYDKDGRLQNWWSNASWTQFQKDASCVTDYYSTYTMSGMQVDGKLTLTENLADIGGLKLVKEGYDVWVADHGKEGKLPGINRSLEELIFVAAAQVRIHIML